MYDPIAKKSMFLEDVKFCLSKEESNYLKQFQMKDTSFKKETTPFWTATVFFCVFFVFFTHQTTPSGLQLWCPCKTQPLWPPPQTSVHILLLLHRYLFREPQGSFCSNICVSLQGSASAHFDRDAIVASWAGHFRIWCGYSRNLVFSVLSTGITPILYPSATSIVLSLHLS